MWCVGRCTHAEEIDLTSRNIDNAKASADPVVRRFLGIEGNSGKGFGLAADFAYDVIKAIGNYKEMYDRNLGPKTKLNIPRRINANYESGGLLYAPPIR
jgi:general L-amino acid transport system substrate-binding protein